MHKNLGARRLIVDADDFGISPGVNKGIIEAHTSGVVTSASLMVNLPAAKEAAAMAQAYPGLEVGLHLNLTCGTPLTSARALKRKQGDFLTPAILFSRLFTSATARKQAAAEISAQVEAYLNLGLPLSHLCGHHHIHVHPMLAPVVAKLASMHGVPVRLPIEPRLPKPWQSRAVMALAIHGLALKASACFRHRAIARPAYFVGHLLRGRTFSTANVLSAVRAIPHGTSELMCHPGYGDSGLGRLTSLTAERVYELETLTDPRLREGLLDLGIELGRWHDLCQPRTL